MAKESGKIETKTKICKKRRANKEKKRLLLIVPVVLIIISFASCGNKKEEVKATAAEERKTIPEEDTGFDFSQVFAHIEINGKSVSFPFAVSELGDEYEVDSINEMGNGEWGASLLYNGLRIASLYYTVEKKEDINRNTMCYEFHIGSMGKGIYVNGISCESNLEDVRIQFPNLPEIYDEEGNIISSEIKVEEKYFCIAYNEDLSVGEMFIDANKK